MYIDYAAKEFNHKIVFFGQPLSGRSTTMHCIYNIAHEMCNETQIHQIPFQYEEKIGQILYFNWLRYEVGTIKRFTNRFHFYTILSKENYLLANKMLLIGVDGIIFMVDSQIDQKEGNCKYMKELRSILGVQQENIANFPLVIQVNKRDLSNIETQQNILQSLELNNYQYCFESIANKGVGIDVSLKAITVQLMAKAKSKLL